MRKIYVIDGNSLLFRAFYATYMGDPNAIMRASDGTPTNAIFAFSNMLLKILSSFQGGEYIAVGFDTDSKTFRKEQYEDYKANRKPAPPELIPQFPLSRELLDCLGIPHFEQHGIEADDICGTIAKKAEALGDFEVQVYTSDKDYLQLVDEDITVNLLKTGMSNMVEVTPSKMEELFGFKPRQIIDYKGLCGDSSDNLPGIAGIGDKTAKKLIAEYGSFDAIVEAAKSGKIKGKLGEKIVAGEAMGRECYNLATMLTDVDLPFGIDDLLYQGIDESAAKEFAAKYGLRQLSARLPARLFKGAEEQETAQKFVESRFELEGEFSICPDYRDSQYPRFGLSGLAFSDGKSCFYLTAEELEKDGEARKALESEGIRKICYNAKQAYCGLRMLGISLCGVSFDPLLAAYIIDSNMASSPYDAFQSIGMALPEGLKGKELAMQVAYMGALSKAKMEESLRENDQLKLLTDLELPLSKVLAGMEGEGFPIDEKTLLCIGAEYRKKRDQAEQQFRDATGSDINLASSKQVSELLYATLGLPNKHKGSTSVEALQQLSPLHPCIAPLLEYRKYSKLVSTYIDGLLPHIDGGRIHTTFNQTLTTTGRLSSSSPNMQNISTRDEESRLVKKAFFYPDGRKILSLDYSQIELRILAALSGSANYKATFEAGEDVHASTARRIFGIPEGEEVPSSLRRRAKAVNFAIIYGTSAYGLSEQIGCPVYEASDLIKAFYRHYPEIGEYLQRIVDEAEKKGYVSTILGRRRYLPGVQSSSYIEREAAKRAALNAPVQGSAADLIKLAMLKIDEYLRKSGLKTKMVLQIHDELLFAIPEDELPFVPAKLKDIMENALDIGVKLCAESGLGDDWYGAK